MRNYVSSRAAFLTMVVMSIVGCEGMFSVAKMLLADDVPPVVVITSPADGDTYYFSPLNNDLTSSGMAQVITVEADISDKAPQEAPGIISNLSVEVIGIPELSDCVTCAEDANTHVFFEYSDLAYSAMSEASQRIELDGSLVTGMITRAPLKTSTKLNG